MINVILTIITTVLIFSLIVGPLFHAGLSSDKAVRESNGIDLIFKGREILEALNSYEKDHGALPSTADLSFLTQTSLVSNKVYLKTIPMVQLSPGASNKRYAVNIEWNMVPGEKIIYTVQPLSLSTCKYANLLGRGDSGVLNVVSTLNDFQCYEESKGVYRLIGSEKGNLSKMGIPPEKLIFTAAPTNEASSPLWGVPPDRVVDLNTESK